MAKRDYMTTIPVYESETATAPEVYTSGVVGDPEVLAMQQIHRELERLPEDARARVLRYFVARYGVEVDDGE